MLFTDIFYSSRIIQKLQDLLFTEKGNDDASNPHDKLSEKFDGDPERILNVGENNIYSLAFVFCLSRDNLIELLSDNKEATKLQKMHYFQFLISTDVIVACIFCATCQLFSISLLLFAVINGMKNEATGLITFTYVSWQLQLVRFICACISHFKFTSEVQ